MNVSDLMTPNPVTIAQEATLREALQTMDRVGCHHLPVINAYGHLAGIITEHDCRLALNVPSIRHVHWQANRMLDHVLVSAVMMFSPQVIDREMPADEVVNRMLDRQIGCLPVMQGKELVGIVTKTDILIAFNRLYRQMILDEPVSES